MKRSMTDRRDELWIFFCNFSSFLRIFLLIKTSLRYQNDFQYQNENIEKTIHYQNDNEKEKTENRDENLQKKSWHENCFLLDMT